MFNHKEYHRQYRKDHPNRLYLYRLFKPRRRKDTINFFRDVLLQSKFCTRCDEYKHKSNFWKQSTGRLGHTSMCIPCSNAYQREKRNDSINHRVAQNLRNRIWSTLKGVCKSKSTEELLGLDIDEFKLYIERQFEDGMSWDNYGDWHIDHIVPCAHFDLSKPHHQEECFFYTNLQPLWAEENFKKSDK